MTIASETYRSGPYIGNGITTIFDYGFRIVSEDHLRVVRAENGVETTLTIDADYSVAGVGNNEGGQITLITAPSASQSITILRNVPFIQETDLENQGPFFAETMERSLDEAVMRDQQLSERLDRAVTIPPSADPQALQGLVEDIIRLGVSADNIDEVANISPAVVVVAGIANDVSSVSEIAGDVVAVAAVADSVPTVAGVASQIPTVAANVESVRAFGSIYYTPKAADPISRDDGSPSQQGDLYFNTTLNQLRMFGGTSWQSVTDQSLNIAFKKFVGDAVATEFALDVIPGVVANLVVSIDGVVKTPGIDYEISGTTLTLTDAPGAGSKVDTWVIATTAVVNTPANESVGAGAIKTDEIGDITKKIGVADLPIGDIETTSIPPSRLMIRPVGFEIVDPLESRWKKIAEPGAAQPWHKQSPDGQWWEIADHIAHPFMFANVGKGNDDSDAFNNCGAFIARAAGELSAAEIIIPPGAYEIDSWDLSAFEATLRYFKIRGYGAQLKPRAGGSEQGYLIKIERIGWGVGLELEGLYLDQSAANNHKYGAIISGSPGMLLRRVYFAGGGNSNLSALRIKQSDTTNGDTGTFWTTIDDCWVRQNGVSNVGIGILLDGSINHTIIKNSKLSCGDGGIAVVIEPEDASGPDPANGVQMLHNAIEHNDYGCIVYSGDGGRPWGLRGISNRFERTLFPWRVVRTSGSWGMPDCVPVFDHNEYLSYSAVITNANGAIIDFRDRRNPYGVAVIPNGETTVDVVFPVPEYTGNYQVALTTDGGDPSILPSMRTDAGFRISRAASGGNLPVQWTLLPRA